MDKSQASALLEIEMRLQFRNTDRVKALARLVVEHSALKHGQALDVAARLCGYRNFHELERFPVSLNSHSF